MSGKIVPPKEKARPVPSDATADAPRNTEVVPREDNLTRQSVVVGHAGRLYPTADTPLSQCPTNIDLSTEAGKAMLMAAGNPGDIEMDREGIARIIATYYLIYPEQRVDPETGEIGTFARTVLFDRDGQTFRTTAAHAPHRIAAALDLYSPARWAQGVQFVIRERKGRRGFTYHDIRVVPALTDVVQA